MFRRPVVRGPPVEDHGDETYHDCAADGGPESCDRESADQIGRESQKKRVDHNEKKSHRENDQGKGEHKENGPDQKIQNCEHEPRGESGGERVDFYAGHNHHREKYGNGRDRHTNNCRANPTAEKRVIGFRGHVNWHYRSSY